MWQAAELQREAGRVDLAIASYQRIASTDPRSRLAAQAQLALARAHEALLDEEEAGRAYERFARLHPGHPEAPAAAVNAIRLLEPYVKLTELRKLAKAATQRLQRRSPRHAAKVDWLLTLVEIRGTPFQRHGALIQRHLDRHARLAPNGQVLEALVRLGEWHWERSCPLPRAAPRALPGVCARRPGRAGKDVVGAPTIAFAELRVLPRLASAKTQAATCFDRALKLWSSPSLQAWLGNGATPAERLHAVRRSAAYAKFMQAELQLEDYLRMKVPTPLDFNPRNPALAKRSIQQFSSWLKARLASGDKLVTAYTKAVTDIRVVLEGRRRGDPYWSIAAVARSGTIFHDFAAELLSVPVPRSLRKSLEAIDAFKTELEKFAIPLLDKARMRYRICRKLSKDLLVFTSWSEHCDQQVHALDPARDPLHGAVLPAHDRVRLDGTDRTTQVSAPASAFPVPAALRRRLALAAASPGPGALRVRLETLAEIVELALGSPAPLSQARRNRIRAALRVGRAAAKSDGGLSKSCPGEKSASPLQRARARLNAAFGLWLGREGQLDNARWYLGAALSCGDARDGIRLRGGLLALSQGDYAVARGHLLALLGRHPRHAGLHEALALALIGETPGAGSKQPSLAEAERHLRLAVSLAPGSATAQLNLAWYEQRYGGRPDQALGRLDRFLKQPARGRSKALQRALTALQGDLARERCLIEALRCLPAALAKPPGAAASAPGCRPACVAQALVSLTRELRAARSARPGALPSGHPRRRTPTRGDGGDSLGDLVGKPDPGRPTGVARPGGLGYGGWGLPLGFGRSPNRKPLASLTTVAASLGPVRWMNVRRVSRRHLNELQYCYVSVGLPQNPKLEGGVTVGFYLQRTGLAAGLTVVESSLKSPAMEACLLSAIKRWRFDSPPRELPLVVLSFEFHPNRL